MPSACMMKTIDSTRLPTRQKVLSVSVQMSDLTPPLLRIEPDEEHRHQRIEPERQPVVAENQQLHDGADHVDTQRGTQHLRHEEEPRPGMVRGMPKRPSRYS